MCAAGLPGPRSGGYDPGHYGNLAAIEDRHFWFRSRNEVIRVLARQVCAGFEPGYRALEIGCGTGNVLRHLEEVCRGGFVVGMDLLSEGFRFAGERCRSALVQGDASRPPFACRFHFIGMFDVMEHVPDDVALLRDAYGLLAPGGVLMVTVPAHMSLWSYFDEASSHCRRYELDELHLRLSGVGFTVEFLSQYMCSLVPLVWLKRRVFAPQKHGAGSRADVAKKEFEIHPFVNGMLTRLLGQEARWLRRRRRLPFGTSLIAIARRPSASE